MARPSDFDVETFKKELLKEIGDDMRQIIRDIVAEMVRKIPFGEQDSETRIVPSKHVKEKLKALVDLTESEWMKNTQRQVDQLQIALKKHRLNPNFVDLDLDLEEEEPLLPKYKFSNMKKYSDTDDPHLHLKQYITYMKATELSKAQIVK